MCRTAGPAGLVKNVQHVQSIGELLDGSVLDGSVYPGRFRGAFRNTALCRMRRMVTWGDVPFLMGFCLCCFAW